MSAKCLSVDEAGEPDGWLPTPGYKVEVSPDGLTRIGISVPPAQLPEVHKALAGALESPVGVLYVQMVDRRAGRQLDTPRRFVGIEKPKSQVLAVLNRCPTLLYQDGRHQLWLRGGFNEQLVLDELGMVWVYPDDPSFRDVLAALGIPEADTPGMDARDYVKVDFKAEADGEEALMLASLGLTERG